MNRQMNVCVLGGGVCGIVATKICLENGFRVECLEKSPHYGGLWHYHDEKLRPNEGFIPSVMKTTILNTSKELSAFSDFPPPANFPNNMKHELYMSYIESYVQNFRLAEHIKLKQEVLKCELVPTSGNQVEWLVRVRDLESGLVGERKFDKLMIATGHHIKPHMPLYPDQHKFRGEIIHSGRIKDVLNDDRFRNKRVAVVGFGNSACDVANDLAIVASRCYLSSHRGNWLLSRFGSHGITEHALKTNLNFFKSRIAPQFLINRRLLKMTKATVDHDFLGLTPKHQPVEQVPIINDLFSFRLYTGGITLKSSVVRFWESGLVFEGEEETEHPVDVVVFATGYSTSMDFIDEYKLGLKSLESNEYELYMNVFAPKLTIGKMDARFQAEVVKSLAVIGLVQASGSVTVMSELQSRWACLVFANKLPLPPVDKMLASYERIRKHRNATIRSHSRDVLVGDWMTYMDEVASIVGVRPNFLKLFLKDFQLWRKLLFGPFVPYQYRLDGPGRCEKAREFVMTVDDRIYEGINEGKNHIIFKTRRRCLNRLTKPDRLKKVVNCN